jgi:hypothetical protein
VGILTKRLKQDLNLEAKLEIQLNIRGQRWSTLKNTWKQRMVGFACEAMFESNQSNKTLVAGESNSLAIV